MWAMLFDPEGSQKGTVWDPLHISLHVRVYTFCRVNIERIWLYTHLLTAKFVPFCIDICQNCELKRFLGICAYVYISTPGFQGPKHSVFTMVDPLVCPPPTRETKIVLQT